MREGGEKYEAYGEDEEVEDAIHKSILVSDPTCKLPAKKIGDGAQDKVKEEQGLEHEDSIARGVAV